MKALKLTLLVLLWSNMVFGQKYFSDQNHVSFFSEAPLENIEAHTYNARSIFDLETGKIAFTIPIRTFEFEKSLMQQHFNEKFMESGKYPRAKFSGVVENYHQDEGKQEVEAKGEIEIHGVTKEISVSGEMEINGNQIKITTTFPLKVADFEIKIPQVVSRNIAKTVDVNLEFNYEPHEEK
ncbi:MAG: YceI family protein [Cyclobacteriaceae bacterium]